MRRVLILLAFIPSSLGFSIEIPDFKPDIRPQEGIAEFPTPGGNIELVDGISGVSRLEIPSVASLDSNAPSLAFQSDQTITSGPLPESPDTPQQKPPKLLDDPAYRGSRKHQTVLGVLIKRFITPTPDRQMLDNLFEGTQSASAETVDLNLDEKGLQSLTPLNQVGHISHLFQAYNSLSWIHSRAEKKAIRRKIGRMLITVSDPAVFDHFYYRMIPAHFYWFVSSNRWNLWAFRKLVLKHQLNVVPGDWPGYLKYLDIVAGAQGIPGNRVESFRNQEKTFREIFQDIQNAKESLHIEFTFLQALGHETAKQEIDLGWQFAQETVKKAAEGIPVRILITFFRADTINPIRYIREVYRLVDFLNKAPGVELKISINGNRFDPLRIVEWLFHMDHRKLIVIDGRIAYQGGVNPGYQGWLDQIARVTGPAVAVFQRLFLTQWFRFGGWIDPEAVKALFPPLQAVPGGHEVRVIAHNGGEDRLIKADFIRAIRTANEPVRLETSYFTDGDIVAALCDKAREGIPVQVIFPRRNNVLLLKFIARSYYTRMIAAGVQVYEYDGMFHQKILKIGNAAFSASSSNMDTLSLEYHDEISLVGVGAAAAEFEKDSPEIEAMLRNSRRIEKHRTLPWEFLSRLLLYLA